MPRLVNPSGDAVYFEGARCTQETSRAILVKLRTKVQTKLGAEAVEKEVWIPKSQVHPDSEVGGRGDEGRLAITDWFAGKEGLEP